MTDHMEFLGAVASEDVAHLREKERTYGGSWKKRGGVGAFMMLARKWDRIENLLGYKDGTQYNIFAAIEANPHGGDSTVLAEIRDLRRYLLLVEAEMVARGVVSVSNPITVPKNFDPCNYLVPGVGTGPGRGVPVHAVGDEERVSEKVAKRLARAALAEAVHPGAFVDGNGELVIPGDYVEYGLGDKIIGHGIVSDILQDGDATITYNDGFSSSVKWKNLCKVPRPVPVEDSNRHAERASGPPTHLHNAVNSYEWGLLPEEEQKWYTWDSERQEWRR